MRQPDVQIGGGKSDDFPVRRPRAIHASHSVATGCEGFCQVPGCASDVQYPAALTLKREFFEQ
jgi:hypothetical protein